MTKTITVEIPAVVNLGIARLDKGIDCDFTKAVDPQAAAMIIFNYGAMRIINDATGGADLSDDARLGKAQKKLDAILAGVARKGGGKHLSPVEKECRAIVAGILVAQKGMKNADAEKAAVKWREIVPADKVNTIVAKAEKNVKARGDLEIELDI